AISYVALLGGDEHALIDHVGELRTSSDVARALQAAIHLGDREAIGRIAKLSINDDGAYGLEKDRGALLCALGDKAGGTAALTKALELWGKFGTTGYLEAQLALAVCTQGVDISPDDVWAGRVEYARQIGGGPPRPLNDRWQNDAHVASLSVLDRS